MPIIRILLGFFGLSGPIASFFIYIGKKIAVKSLILPIQFIIVGALFTAKVSMLIALISLIYIIYTSFNDLINYINALETNTALDIPLKILDSLGIISAVYDTVTVFTVPLVSLLVIYVTKYFIESLKLASDEFFKIGMLLQG
jgi:hypothetical protein